MSIPVNREKKPSYFREVQQEFKRVNWTTREELIVFTRIVVGATLFFGVGIYGVDLIIRGVLGSIEFLARMIVG